MGSPLRFSMTLASPKRVKKLLAEHGLRPKKRLGQHFLIDRNVLERIADAVGIVPGDWVMEIGTGLGILTRELASRGARVVTVEIDRAFIPILDETLAGLDSVEVVVADFLSLDLPSFLSERCSGKWIVAGNLPYYITSPIISRLLFCKDYLSRVVVTVQKEVAERFSASAGSENYSALSVFVQFHCEVELLMTISPNVFIPVPEVESALVQLVPRKDPPVEVDDEELFFRIVRAAFGKRRKTLLNALGNSPELNWTREQAGAVIERVGIEPSRRGETLSIQEFARLSLAAGAMLEK
ncbi:MAG: 16S rRNA (adenine(1518)-N(6)/adenine(1519)-N(6))-dimethyltransferase RsmA [Armatimonadota bacterium]